MLLPKQIALLATFNLFLMMAWSLAVGLTLILMSQANNFKIPFAPYMVVAISLAASGYASKSAYALIHDKVIPLNLSIQKVLIAIMLIVTASLFYGIASGL